MQGDTPGRPWKGRRGVFPATLCDYNGLLVDDEQVHLDAFRAVLGRRGIELSTEDYWEKYLGFDDVGAFRAVLTDAGHAPTDAEVRALVEEKKPEYLTRAEGTLRAFDGAADLVRRRAALGPVWIVSGALRDEIALGLDVLDVRDCIAGVIAAEDVALAKPDPEGYLLGIERLTASLGAERARRALVLEDSLAGVTAAHGAGLLCATPTHSYPADALVAAGSDLVVAVLDEIDDAALVRLYASRFG